MTLVKPRFTLFWRFFAPSVVTDMFFMPSDLIPLCLPETLLTHLSLAYKLGACQGDDEGPVLR
jgi:hypothetical protein